MTSKEEVKVDVSVKPKVKKDKHQRKRDNHQARKNAGLRPTNTKVRFRNKLIATKRVLKKGAVAVNSDTPETFRAKLLALSEAFPMMMPQTVGPGDTSVDMDMPVAPMSSINKINMSFIGLTGGGAYWYSFYFFYGSGYLIGKTVVATTMTTEGTVATLAVSNDNLYSLINTFVNSVQTNAMCVRIMNATPLLTSGGEIIMGTIPSSLMIAGQITWTLLYNYINTQQMDLPMAEDVCMPWMKICPNDSQSSPVGNGAQTSSNSSVQFVAVRCVGPTATAAAPVMDLENYNNYTITPLPNYQKIFQAKVQPISEDALMVAKRKIGLSNKASSVIMPTSAVASAFTESAKALGANVVKYVGKKLPGWIDSAVSWVSGLFGDFELHKLSHLLTCPNPATIARINELEKTGVFPEHFASALRNLFAYRLQFNDTALQIENPMFDTHIAQMVTEKGLFSSATALKVSTIRGRRRLPDDDDVKSLDSPRPTPSVRALSKPRS